MILRLNKSRKTCVYKTFLLADVSKRRFSVIVPSA